MLKEHMNKMEQQTIKFDVFQTLRDNALDKSPKPSAFTVCYILQHQGSMLGPNQ